jgi:NAD(P)-dependent dehydrogenase (short-subunit alcohol dehydrogenase family)
VLALGGLDGLGITAGVTQYAPIAETTSAEWDRILRINLVAAGLLTRAALPMLRKSGDAAIVVTASAAARRGYADFTAYSSSKAGLIHWTGAAARELGPQGIRVNCVSPGPIDTPMLRGPRPPEERDDWAAHLATRTALGRVGQPNEVAEAIAFLLGRRSSYVTGALLDCDGGETA